MKKETFFTKIDGKSPAELEKVLNRLSYDSIYELWNDITGNVIEFRGDMNDPDLPKIKKDLRLLYKMDIYARIMNGAFQSIVEKVDNNDGADA